MTGLARVASALVLATALAASPADAQTSTPPDVVRLRDGTFLRGTLVESSPTRVIVILPTGDTRTYPAEQVEFVGPDVPTTPAPPPPTVAVVMPRGPTARLHVRSRREGLSLSRMAGSATVRREIGRIAQTARVDEYEMLCRAPCDIDVPEGIHQLGVGQGIARAQRSGPPLELRGEMTLELGYDDRTLTRVAGWLTLGLGVSGGLALIFGGVLDRPFVCSGTPRSCGSPNDVPMLVVGGVVIGVSIIVGLVLVGMFDAPSIEVVSDGVRF